MIAWLAFTIRRHNGNVSCRPLRAGVGTSAFDAAVNHVMVVWPKDS